MIVGIRGELVKVEPTFLHIDVSGLIYEVNVSLNCSNSIQNKNSENREIKLLITQIIKEDSNTLCGFLDENEKKIFERLIKISGIGVKVAMAICSTFTPQTFGDIISSKDFAMLKKVPGIGVKTAKRVILELTDFEIRDSTENSSKNDAILALESLGFKREAILKVLSEESGDTASLVKMGLKRLSKV